MKRLFLAATAFAMAAAPTFAQQTGPTAPPSAPPTTSSAQATTPSTTSAGQGEVQIVYENSEVAQSTPQREQPAEYPVCTAEVQDSCVNPGNNPE